MTRPLRSVFLSLTAVGCALVAAHAARASDESGDAEPLTGTPLKQSAKSTIELKRYGANTLLAHKRRTSFEIFHGLDAMLLLQEKIEVEDLPPWKGEGFEQETVELVATELGMDGSPGKVRYRIRESGQDALIYGALYVVSSEGCCDSQDGRAIYSIATGKRLMYTTGSTPLGALESFRPDEPRAETRWVGLSTPNSAYSQAVFAKHDRNALAVVTYASDEAPLMRVLVTHSGLQEYLGKMELRRTAKGPKAPARISVHAELGDTSFDIPIAGDALDVAHASGSEGVVFRAVSLDGKL
jgi:hypothetical protein